jgi:hypothetical protein
MTEYICMPQQQKLGRASIFFMMLSLIFVQIILTALGFYIYNAKTDAVVVETEPLPDTASAVEDRGGEGTIIWPEKVDDGYTEEEITRLAKENPAAYPATTSEVQ